MMIDYAVLRKVPLFDGISGTELEKLLDGLNLSKTRFAKGETLARQGEICNRLIILLTGSVKGEMIDPSGKVINVEDLHAPYALSILFMFGPENRFPMEATAREETTALIIPAQVVFKLLTKNETFLRNALITSSMFATRLVRKLKFISFRTISQKLAMYLLELSRTSKSKTFMLDKTHEVLAAYFGVSRQALEREIKNMVAKGLITVERRKVTILDSRKLENLVLF